MARLKRVTEIQKRQQVAELLKQGLTQKQIAHTIGVTEKTVGKWLKPHKLRVLVGAKILATLEKRLNNEINADAPKSEILATIRLIKEVKTL